MARSMFSSLEPNTTYTHPSSHGEYHTDEYGRVAKFSADPRITSKEERERNTENQRTLEGKGPGYEHAGHLVADRHGGSGEKFNIVPMQEAVDSRDYAAFEKETDGILQSGYNVHYNGEICYSGAETVKGVNRSEAIMVERQTIDPESGAVVDRDYTSLSNMNMTEFENVGNRESEELMDGARMQVEMALDRSLSDNMHDWASVKARVREALSSYIYRKTKRNPMILPVIMEV